MGGWGQFHKDIDFGCGNVSGLGEEGYMSV